jgi:hypothetical protein
MATTTPNFGWVVPTSTDLVKDGATAIETLGDSIDASMVDLKGGTTGQVLSKNSNSDMDFTWAAAGGKILQIVTASYNTEVTVASTSATNTGLTASITPSLSTSKVMVIISQPYMLSRDNNDIGLRYQIVRGASTNIVDIQGSSNLGLKFNAGLGAGSGIQSGTVLTYNYIDSPATTSSTTYKTTGSVYTTSNSASVSFQWGSAAPSQMILIEIGA